jgi:Ca2+-binding EF-hand superfamily protein
MSTLEVRRSVALSLFSECDLDGNGVVGLQELLQVIQSSRRGGDKKHVKRIRQLEAEIRQAVETNKKTGNAMQHMALKSGGLVSFAQGHGEPSLDPEAFASVVVALTKDDSAEDFNGFVATARAAVDDAVELTRGSQQRRAVWSMFQLLDVNQDGFVDLAELEVLLDVETKSDKKAVSKWRAVLSQRKLEYHALAPITSALDALASTNVSPETTASGVFSVPGDDHAPLKLTLADFQHFILEFTENDESRVEALLSRVREAMQTKYNAYLEANRVNQILDSVLEDLIRERPHDVLDGIIRSCERIKRTGTIATGGLQRVQSSVTIRDMAGRAGRTSRTGSQGDALGAAPDQ